MPIAFAAFSQNGVALVLSGGGAKGVTHIGVIRALEDYGIPIDYVAGTSMGAIIGGLYASGYSPDEMEDIIKSDDFKNWVSGRIPNKYKFYYKEDIPNASWLNFKVNYDSILATNILPTNIISPEQMDFAFMEIFSRANAVAGEDFDNLMIPFRCVASDVAGNKAVILKDGNLGAAVRASMTFPFYFKPIRIDSTLLFDGGMYNNFPVDVVIEDFNPDLIIGCKAAGNYGPPDEDNLISQLQTMLMEKTNYVVPEDKGVLIEPQLKKTNVVDFKNTDAFIDSGYVAAVRSIPEIISRLDEVKDPSYFSLRRFRFNDVQPDFIIKNFDIEGLSKPQENYIQKLLAHQSDSILISDFRFEYFKLLAEHQFDRLYPLASYNEDTQAFDIKLEVDRQRSIDVQFGGLLSSNPVNEANIGLTYHHLGKIALRFGANTYVGRFYSSARLWGRADFPERKPYYLLASLNFSQKDYFETSTYFFEDKNLSYLIQNENYMDIILGFPTRHRGKFEIGISSGNTRDDYYQQNNFLRSDTADLTYFDMINAGLKYEINSLNRKQFASKGVRLFLSLKYQWGLENYEPGSTSFSNSLLEKEHDYLHLNIIYENFFISKTSFQIGFYSQLMMSTRKAFSNYVASVLSAPAFSPVPESRSLFMPEFRAFNFGALGLRTVIPVRPNLDFRIEAYGFQPYQELKKADNGELEFGKFFSDRYYMGSGSLIFHSPLGPVSLVFNYFDRAEDEFSFNVNFGYYIFNPSLKD